MGLERDEHHLIAGLRRGDREAQRELYTRTSERIYRLLLRMMRSADDAAELTQETYLRAFARIGQFDGRSALATWLYRIAVNEALQHQRRTARRPTVDRAPAAGAVAALSDNERAAERMDIEAALAELPGEDRAILLLRHHEGLDYAAIAEAVGCPQGTVASRLNRARARLRKMLGPAYGGVEESGAPRHPIDRCDSARAEAPERGSVRAERPGAGSG